MLLSDRLNCVRVFCAVITLHVFSVTAVAQTAVSYVEKLEAADTRADFQSTFEEMILQFKAGKLVFSDDDVTRIVSAARQKSFAAYLLPGVYGWAGTMYGDGRMDEAIRYFMESAELYEQQEKKIGEALSYFEIALIQHKAENFDEAEDYYKKTLSVGGDSLDHRTRINCHNGLALLLRQQKKPEEAIRDFRKAYRLATSHQDTVWMGILSGNIGSVHLQKGDYDSSLYYYFRNLKFIKNTTEFENEIETYAHLGRVYTLRKDYALAKQYLDSASGIIQERNIRFNDFFNPMDYISEGYALLYAATGDYQKAFEHHRQFHEIMQRKQENINGRSLKQLQSAYAFNQKQRELELFKEINAANLLMIRQQTYITVASGFIILLLSVLALFVLRTSRQRKRLNKELNNSNAELERLNHFKDKLFSVISHDLRGPIGNLRSILTLLRGGHLKQVEFERILEKLSLQVEVSGNALENLLQWAKAQLSNVKVEPENVHFFSLVERVAQQFAKDASEKDITFSNALSTDLTGWADRNQIEIVLRNLMANAFKFTPTGGKVRVTGKHIDNKVEIAIEDTGIGMSEDEVQSLFQPGKHFTTPGTNQEKGTGIGLLITKELTENNKGSIRVESAKGKGTTFTITLPAGT